VERPTHGAAVQMVELDGLSSHLQVELELKNAQVEQLERQVEKLRSELLRERWHRRDLERKLDRMVGQVEMEKITNPKVSTLSELLM
jgi:predicted RNase H-like nuclease (RuvC/YqgF family)